MATGLQRFLYKRILPGDVRKLLAQSNTQDVKTGGGARDMRFGPWKQWEHFVSDMFPNETTERGRRKVGTDDQGRNIFEPAEKIVYTGEFHWYDDNGEECHTTVKLWTPTDSRGGEGRLARARNIEPYRPERMPQVAGAEVVFFMCQDDQDLLWGSWVTDVALRTEGWHPEVADRILRELDSAPADVNVRGWVDLPGNKEKHFHG